MIKFTIGTASNDIQFDETIRLIKSSLLYADEIELLGLLEFTAFCYLPRRINNIQNLEQLINVITPCLKGMDLDGGKELLAQVEDMSAQLKEFSPILSKKKLRSRNEILAQMQAKQLFLQGYDEIKSGFQSLFNSRGSQEISSLVKNNIVTVHDYSTDDYVLDELLGGYFGNLINSVHVNTSYPLFDSISVDVIRTAVKTNLLDIGRLDGEVLRHAGIASGVLMTLPTLNNASIDEILDFKRQNESSLINFRKAIFDFSEKINSLPWDENFKYDIIKLYSTEVFPKVEELNSLASETSTLKNFGSKVLADEEFRRKVGWAVGGIATTVVSQSSLIDALGAFRNVLLSISLLTISPQIAMGFLKSINLLNISRKETLDKKKEMTGNTMYYYYKAKKEL